MHRMTLFLAPLILSICACSTISPTDPATTHEFEPDSVSSRVQEPAPAKKRGPRHEFSLSRQSVEFDEVTIGEFDVGGVTTPETDINDVEQTLTRLRYRFGSRASGFIVGVLADDTEEDQSGVTFDLVGIELGTDGFPHLGSSTPVAPAIDYGFSFSGRVGDDDSSFFGGTETDIYLIELAARIGGGVDINGLRVSAGWTGSVIGAGLDNDVVDEPFSASATNFGPYLRIWFSSDDFPLIGGIQVMGGDIRGASIGVGVHF